MTMLNRPNQLSKSCTQFKSPGLRLFMCCIYIYNASYTCNSSLSDMEIPGTINFIPKGFELGTSSS